MFRCHRQTAVRGFEILVAATGEALHPFYPLSGTEIILIKRLQNNEPDHQEAST
jgi:hypothetical protein